MSEESHHAKPKLKIPSFELTPSVSILLAGIIIAGAVLYTNHSSAPAAAAVAGAANQPTAAAVKVPAPSNDDHIIGSPSAPVVMIEYSDFQCPYCQMIMPSLQKITNDSNGQVAWVYREFPLYQIHPNALPGANAAECIAEQLGNDGFWKFTVDDFNNQSSISPEFFANEAKKLGADMTKYNSCISNSTYLSKIQQQTADAEAAGGNGTPFTVFVNTKTGKQYPVSGALPLAQLQAVLEQAKTGK